MLTETTDYATLYRDFRWDIPARFNIATACCDRHADGTDRLALIYVDEDGATHAYLVRRDARDIRRASPMCLQADGLAARRPRRGFSVAVAGTADRASGSVPLGPGIGAAVYAVRRGCAGLSPGQFRRQGDCDRRDRLGKAFENTRPAAGSAADLRDRRRGRRRHQIVLAGDRVGLGAISRPSIHRPTIPPSSSTPPARPETRRARCTPIACCSATCPMSRWCMIFFQSPAT